VSTQYRKRWVTRTLIHIIRPDGSVMYDDEPHGNDKPIAFRDEDEADKFVERMNFDLLMNADCGDGE
jgi:hypothetical protein